jgi:sigma-B regulation protein RsbU (phosphoserine phosphatase)
MAGEVMQVQPGDVLLLYTDGLEEGKDPSGQEFGVQRIIAALQAEHAKPGPYLLGALFYEFDRFSSGVAQEDDLTAVCVRFK